MKKITNLFLSALLIFGLIAMVGCTTTTFTVKFETNGGTAIKDVTVEEGRTISEPAEPTKEGYKFTGWFTDDTLATKFDFNTQITANMTLYAGWKKNDASTFTVKFETNGGTVIKDVEVEEGMTISEPAEPTKEGYKFTGWFTDNTLATKFDFNTKIKADTTLYAGWEAVEPASKIFVMGVSPRSDFLTHNANKQEKTNKRNEFMDLTKMLIAGNENAFKLMPEVTFIEIDTETNEVIDVDVHVESWEFEIRIYELIDNTYIELASDSNLIDSIDTTNCLVDFSTDAVNRQFKITVVPTGLTEAQQKKIENYTTSVECVVIKGYNVYTALDFAYLEHRTDDADSQAWNAFKLANGLDANFKPSTMILQSNIHITYNDVPSHFFWSSEELKGASDADRALNSMKDYKNLYRRDLTENETFTVIGNYFTVDISAIKEVVREKGNITPEGEVISHASFLRFEGPSTSRVELESLNLVGNAPRVEDAIKSGGEIFAKVEGPAFKAYNNISIGWFIAYMPNRTDAEFIMEKCRAYDSYNCFVYNWGSELVYIRDCEMIGAGGPVIIQDHVNPKSGGHVAKTYITNSKLESYVTGSEGWFKGVHADALVPTIKGADAAFNYFGRSFLKANADKSLTYLNFICVNKSGDAESLQPAKIDGELKIDDLPSFDFGTTNPYVKALIEANLSTGAPVFQTSASGYAYATTKELFDEKQNQIIDPTNAIYQGDYLAMYYAGTMIVFGYNKFNPSTGEYEVYTTNYK